MIFKHESTETLHRRVEAKLGLDGEAPAQR